MFSLFSFLIFLGTPYLQVVPRRRAGRSRHTAIGSTATLSPVREKETRRDQSGRHQTLRLPMARDAPFVQLFDSVRSAEGHAGWVGEWWHAEAPNILPLLPELKNRDDPLSSCQMDTLGRHILHMLRVVSRFAELLVDGPYISAYTDLILEELVENDDRTLLNYIDDKQDAPR